MEKIIKEIMSNGTIVYRNENGEYHNINDEPAIIYENGSKLWCKNGYNHRIRGPAFITTNGDKLWYYRGNHITEKVNNLMKEGHISSDWENWTEEDIFLFVLLVS